MGLKGFKPPKGSGTGRRKHICIWHTLISVSYHLPIFAYNKNGTVHRDIVSLTLHKWIFGRFNSNYSLLINSRSLITLRLQDFSISENLFRVFVMFESADVGLPKDFAVLWCLITEKMLSVVDHFSIFRTITIFDNTISTHYSMVVMLILNLTWT